MIRRALQHAILLGTAAAAAALAVFSLGFALYALLEPLLGPPGAAAIVALAAALIIAVITVIMLLQIQADERRAEEERARRAAEGPQGLAGFAQGHPLIGLGLSALAGLVSTRYPGLVDQIMSILTPRRPS